MSRQRIYHTLSFEERCKELARIKLEAAAKLPAGPARDSLEREVKELKNVTHIEEWLSSAHLQPPT